MAIIYFGKIILKRKRITDRMLAGNKRLPHACVLVLVAIPLLCAQCHTRCKAGSRREVKDFDEKSETEA